MAGPINVAKRLSQRDWLERAMSVLAREGGARVTIDRLCQELGVTKGSFYGHFVNREDFMMKLIAFWDEEFTQVVISELKGKGDQPAEERLLKLMQLLNKQALARYDVAVRAWAAQDAAIANEVHKVFRSRYKFVRALFQEIGFRDAELDMRVRVFVLFHSSDYGMYFKKLGKSAQEREILLRHAFFTRPAG